MISSDSSVLAQVLAVDSLAPHVVAAVHVLEAVEFDAPPVYLTEDVVPDAAPVAQVVAVPPDAAAFAASVALHLSDAAAVVGAAYVVLAVYVAAADLLEIV